MTQAKSKKKQSPVRPKVSAASPDQVVELYGPDKDGWYDTRVMDWIGLCELLKDGEVRGYLVLRSLVVDKFRNNVRKLTLQLLCELIPSPSGGPSSLTRIRSILDGLTKVGLVTTPEGQPIKTSSRTSALAKTLRLRINDAAPADYAGWRNAEDKLKALGTALVDLVEEGPEDPPATADEPPTEAGRISDPQEGAGRKSDPTGRESDPRGRESDPDARADLVERDLPLVLSSGSSLSSAPGTTAVTPVAAEGRTEQTRETAAPTDKPAAAAAGVPAPREGEADTLLTGEAVAMLVGLPGEVHPRAAAKLAPLVLAAVADGWTLAQLHTHLSRKCDPTRVRYAPAVYERHLGELPPPEAGALREVEAPPCEKCQGSGLIEDPETFLPIGRCDCRRKAPALAAVAS